MAWSTVTIGMVSPKPDDCGVSLLSRSSYKVQKRRCSVFTNLSILSANGTDYFFDFLQNKYSSFSWTEDETQSLYKEVNNFVEIFMGKKLTGHGTQFQNFCLEFS